MAPRNKSPEFYHFWKKKPKRGTKLRAILIEMLRPGGTTYEELVAKGIIGKGHSITNCLDRLETEFSWVIRREAVTGARAPARGGRHLAYRVVGKLKEQGRLVSYERWTRER